ncbi:vacuolar H[+] ATPase 100kD subunit 3 [Cochliomyia hominivorax]
MSFFRSELMSLCRIILHHESAFNCLIELGYVGKVQFRHIHDDKTIINNQFSNEIKRCYELKEFLLYLQQEIDDLQIKTVIYPDVDEDEIPEANDLKFMENIIQQHYEDLLELTNNLELLKRQQRLLNERLQVLQKADEFLETSGTGQKAIMAWSDSIMKMLIKNDMRQEEEYDSEITKENLYLGFITGTIPQVKFHTFETILWRIGRGSFLIKYDVWREGDSLRKYIFMIFFIGQELGKIINKICQGFGIELYECAESNQERQKEQELIQQELKDIEVIIQQTQTHRFNLLLVVSADIYIWRVKMNKILKVYFVLNRLKNVKHLPEGKYYQAECWIPSRDINEVRDALILGARRTAKGSSKAMFIPMLQEIHKPHLNDADKPTYFVVNKFTQGFQNLIDAYGTALYQELNPAPYTIITFPFLFAVMFGDIGHGVIMTLFGLWMILREKSLEEKNRFSEDQNEIWNILFAGRYIIALMGAFSIYTGFIYNDCFSKAFNIFGSSWRIHLNKTLVKNSLFIQLDPSDPDQYLSTPYVFGMDPIWDASGEHAIITFNSLKMKLAIILGVTQMIFGLSLSAFNYIYKKDYIDFLLVFLPQITFLLSIFAYLAFLIFFKWVNFGADSPRPYNSGCAPSILIIFINMLLMKSTDEPTEGCESWMFELQPYLQTVLLVLAFLSVPILLAGKPVYFMIQQKKIKRIENETLKRTIARSTMTSMRKSLVYNVESFVNVPKSKIEKIDEDDDEEEEEEHEKTDLSELWIHSGIHCIESILGSVSHTASYLRLWALSLAHDQLSTVLWNMILKIGLTGKHGYFNSVILFVVFIFWSVLTLAILVVMEGLSAFLHTLRLHWVEFQSKFYAGSGVSFQPFYFGTSKPYELE